MTLCVAWKVGEEIFFASDSRISNGDKYSDYGVKIAPIQVTIYGPTDDKNRYISPIAFQKKYGMCFAGSFTGAYVVKEFLILALQHLQYIPWLSRVSFYRICRIVEKFYKLLAINLSEELDYDHSINFFLSGYCPEEKKIKLAKFSIDYGDEIDEFFPKMKIYDDDNFIEFTGSGEEKFESELNTLNNEDPTIAPLIALRNIIQKGVVLSVGGNIQTGRFNASHDFSISGIVDAKVDENGFIDKIKYCYAGIDMHGDEFESDGSDYFITGSYIDPFGVFAEAQRTLNQANNRE